MDDVVDEVEQGVPRKFYIKKPVIIILLLILGIVVMVPLLAKMTKKEEVTFEDKIKKLIPTIDSYVEKKGYQTPVTFVFSDEGVIPILEVDEYKPISGSITVLKDGGYIINQVSDGKSCISSYGSIDNLTADVVGECQDLTSMIPADTNSGVNDGNVDNGGGSKPGGSSDPVPKVGD